LQPDNEAARNLLAIYAYQQKDYQIAINYWEKLLPHYPVNSTDGQIISQAIANAQKLINAHKNT
jgi:cytochrome c-type biogenesis protein CcmH/NrfG